MQTLTIYVTTADVTTLNAIFNGVAMICQQTVFIWGCALLASMWILLATVTQAPIAAMSGNAQGVLPKGSLSAVMPFILAMLITNPGLQSDVQVESTSNGRVTVISHVPFVISAIPATGSILSQQAGKWVETAYQSTGTDYASISASGNGFINPLKVLLASRSAINRLNGISSQIDSVVTSCLPPDSGVDYANINNLVSNAGNSGATAATSIPVYGANPTAIGALLYQASLGTGLVSAIGPPGTVLNCVDAANLVANNIGTALQSVEFSRIVQGAVNGMDEPNIAANTQIDNITQQWDATRNANQINVALAIGSQQAQSEVINLLMGELVSNELSCLSTSGQGRTICESALVQANEIERNNIQFAAGELPMLKYAGSFGNYLLALIIGLGPIVVMLMMFSGVNAGKCVKTVAHLIAWPLLVTNVGAELINGMMYISVANFTQSIANGGVISLAENVAIYKELSFQIGSASHMMASLPVIMGMIFALGESAALVNVGSNLGPKEKGVVDSVTPGVNEQKAIFSNSGMGGAKHFAEGATKELNASMPMINASSQEGQDISRASSTLQSALSTNKTKTENAQVAKDNSNSVSTLNFKGWGFNDSDAEAFRAQEALHRRESSNDQAGDHTSSTSDNEVSSQANAGVSASASTGSGVSVGVSAGGTTSGQAKSGLHKNYNAGHDDAVNKSKDTTSVLERALTFAKTHDNGGKATKEINRRLSAQQQYSEALTTNDTATDTQSKALEQTDSITGYSAAITDDKLVAGMNRIPELGMYMNVEGEKLKSNSAVQKNLDVARRDADSSATSDIVGDENGREGALLFRAAQLTSQDQTANPEDRLEARQFLAGALSTMMHGGVKPQAIAAPRTIDAKPENKTGMQLPSAAVPPVTKSATSQHSHNQKATHTQSHPAAEAQHAGEPPAPLTEAAANFKKDFDKPLHAGFNPDGTVKSMDKHARSQGLGKDQDGTMHRVGTVMAGAVKDYAHDRGSLSPVNYGEGGAVEKRVAEKIAAEKAKKAPDVPNVDLMM
jgi:conjugal transfer mating pair stabilization protein TraG